jgi:trigger factor
MQLIVSEKKLENARMELEIEVPETNIEKEYEKVFNEYQKNAKIDGFRKGKVPHEMIVKRFHSSADADVAENIVKEAYLEALKEKDLRPISEPEIKFENKLEKSKPFKFNIKFDIAPTVTLGDYKKISAKENECKIDNKDIEKELQALRERYATVSKKEKGEHAEKGNYVRAEARRIDNVNSAEISNVNPQNLSMILGKDTSDQSFDEDILGMKVDEEKEVIKKFPKDHPVKELAGQKAKFLLKVIEISNLSLPALDDEFAKDLGEFSTLEDVKNKIREDFENFAKEKIKKLVNNELMGKIIENSKFDLPESIIKREVEGIIAKLENNMGLKSGGINDLYTSGALKKDEFLVKIREEALQNIKATLILVEIAKAENIKPSEEKYKEIVNSYSVRANKSVEEIEKLIDKNGSRENIEGDLVLNSAVEFIYNNANIKKSKPISFEELQKL